MCSLALAGVLLISGLMHSARAELVVVVSSENPNSELTPTELSDLFLGRQSRFPNGDPAVPLNHRDSSDTYSAFHSQYLNLTPAQVRTHWSRLIFTGRGQPPRSVSNCQAMAEQVAEDPRKIGYLDIDMIDERLQVVRIEPQ